MTFPKTTTMLEAQQIGRRSRDRNAWLFHDVSLSINAGDRIAVVGPSGTGKTVLLRALALLDPLDEGHVVWRGRSISAELVPKYRSRVLYVHQRPALVDGTVRDNLTYPFQFSVHSERSFDPDWVGRALTRLGRDGDFLTRRSRDLSGGEMQVTALLRALQLDPDLLLLDEPSASLDAATTDAVERLVLSWQRERERSFVLVSHDPQQVRRMVQRTWELIDGTIAATRLAGAPDEDRNTENDA